MKIRNQILNYFVIPEHSGNAIRLFKSPVTMNAVVAKKIIENQKSIENLKKDIVRIKDMKTHCEEIESIYRCLI